METKKFTVEASFKTVIEAETLEEAQEKARWIQTSEMDWETFEITEVAK